MNNSMLKYAMGDDDSKDVIHRSEIITHPRSDIYPICIIL